MNQITIKQNEGGSFYVIQGDRYADGVAYDEMLGLVSALTMPEKRPCVHWLMTKEQHEAIHKSYKDSNRGITDVEFETIK